MLTLRNMTLHDLAGQPAPPSLLTNIPRLVAHYYETRPDPQNASQRVSFGTSGHRGTSLNGSFNEAHILAVSQAVAEHRAAAGITGPLYLGLDTHALSEPAWMTALQVLVANGVRVRAQPGFFTPTPLISHAILNHNRAGGDGTADGIVITPSHNPPQDGGFKYNPPSGGPADTDVTGGVQARANALLEGGLRDVRRVGLDDALAALEPFDFVAPYVAELDQVVDLATIRESGVRLGVDPLGGASLPVWEAIRDAHGLNLTIVNETVDPRFAFMPVDRDGKIRMDCSSPYAMAGLLRLKDDFDVAVGNDPDADRHGIVTADGLMNPNHYLAVMIGYLFQNRPGWSADAGVGKTLVSSALIDRVTAGLGRRLVEVPVGFKYFVDGLLTGSLGFGGEESAGASFLRMDEPVVAVPHGQGAAPPLHDQGREAASRTDMRGQGQHAGFPAVGGLGVFHPRFGATAPFQSGETHLNWPFPEAGRQPQPIRQRRIAARLPQVQVHPPGQTALCGRFPRS